MYYAPTTAPENQLPTGVPLRPIEAKPMANRPNAVIENNWNDDEWEEQPIKRQGMRPVAESIDYDEYEEAIEEDNWGESVVKREPAPRYHSKDNDNYSKNSDYDESMDEDMWDDDDGESDYRPQKVNIPQKQKMPEYEEY